MGFINYIYIWYIRYPQASRMVSRCVEPEVLVGRSWALALRIPSDPFGSLRQAGADKNHRERPALDTAVRWCLGSLLVWYLVSGWWFGTYMGYFIFPYIGIFIIPTDEVIFLQRGRYTTNQVYCSGILRICLDFWTLESLEHAESPRNVKHKTLASNHGLAALHILGTISGFWILGDEIIPGFEKKTGLSKFGHTQNATAPGQSCSFPWPNTSLHSSDPISSSIYAIYICYIYIYAIYIYML